MKKKRSIGRLIVIAAICFVFAVLTVFGFALPGSSKDNDFVGFARAINFGVEYKGGTVQTYSANLKTQTNEDIQKGIESNVSRIKYLLKNEGYDINTYQNGNNIVVEFFDEYSPVGIDEVINAKTNFQIKGEESDTAEALVTAADVADAYATKSGSQNILVITFTDSGATNFAKAIEKGTGYFYIGTNLPFSLTLSNASSNFVGIIMNNFEMAQSYASQIVASKYDMSFENIASVTITKADANRNVIVLITLVLIAFIASVVLLVSMYKTLGLVGSLTLFAGLLLQILLLQAVPESVFTFTGAALFASLLCLALGTISIFVMYNAMHKEYKSGKILSASVKFGFNKTWAKVLDMFVAFFIPSVFAYFFGSFLVKQFAMAMICGLAVYALIIIVLTKFMTKWLTFIKFKNKDYGFKREANTNELK